MRGQRRGEGRRPCVDSMNGAAGEDEEERRQEGEERHHRRAATPASERAIGAEDRLRPAADEADERDHHDQRPRRGLAERQAVDHLRRRQPVLLDRALVDVRQHRVGAAERQQRRLGEEPRHLRQRRLPAAARPAPPAAPPTAPRHDRTDAPSRAPRKRACAGVGVSSSMSAGPMPSLPARVAAAAAKLCRREARPDVADDAGAERRSSGNGSAQREDGDERRHGDGPSQPFFSAREPMR